MILTIVTGVFGKAKPIFDWNHEYYPTDYLVLSQINKGKSFLEQHRINYYNKLEKFGLDYVGKRELENENYISVYDYYPYYERININKLSELKELGLTVYGEGANKDSDEVSILMKGRFKDNLSYITLRSQIIITGTVISNLSPLPLPQSSFNSSYNFKINEIIKGGYSLNNSNGVIKVYFLHGHQIKPKDYFTPEGFMEPNLKIGKKYLLFISKSVDKKSIASYPKDILDKQNYSTENCYICPIINNVLEVEDSRNFANIIYNPKTNSINIDDAIKLIKKIEKTNDTENFYNLDFK